MEGYCTVNQAAERLGVSTQRVHKLLSQGRLEGELVGQRCWLIRLSSVMARLADPPPTGWHGQTRNQNKTKGAT